MMRRATGSNRSSPSHRDPLLSDVEIFYVIIVRTEKRSAFRLLRPAAREFEHAPQPAFPHPHHLPNHADKFPRQHTAKTMNTANHAPAPMFHRRNTRNRHAARNPNRHEFSVPNSVAASCRARRWPHVADRRSVFGIDFENSILIAFQCAE